MTPLDLTRADWRKSSRSSNGAQCVEVAAVDGAVAVRDSKNPTGPTLCFTPTGWASFVSAAKSGAFDRT